MKKRTKRFISQMIALAMLIGLITVMFATLLGLMFYVTMRGGIL